MKKYLITIPVADFESDNVHYLSVRADRYQYVALDSFTAVHFFRKGEDAPVFSIDAERILSVQMEDEAEVSA